MDPIIEQAAEAIITTRDFCGDEREAAREALIDNDARPTAERIKRAFDSANAQWRASQKKAGVKNPIHAHERAAIERALAGE